MPSVVTIKDGEKYRGHFYIRGARSSQIIYAKSLDEATNEAYRIEGMKLGIKQSEVSLKKTTVSKAYDDYLEGLRNQIKPIKPKTYEKYKKFGDYYIKRYFGDWRPDVLTVVDIQNYIDWLRSPDARMNKSKKKPLAPNTIAEAYSEMEVFLKHCQRLGIIDENPCDKLRPGQKPTKEAVEVEWYHIDEIKKMIACLNEEVEHELNRLKEMEASGRYAKFTIMKDRTNILAHRLSIIFCFCAGCRRGEMLGLRRSDIYSNGKVRLCHNVCYTREEGVYEENFLKNQKERYVYISQSLINLIKEYLDVLDETIECSDGRMQKTDRVFVSLVNTTRTTLGGLPNPDNYSDWFWDMLRRHDLRHVHFHALRHSFAAYCLHRGVSLFTLAKLTGHSNTKMIETTYGHLYDSDQENVTRLFATIDSDTEEQEAQVDDVVEITNEREVVDLFEGII